MYGYGWLYVGNLGLVKELRGQGYWVLYKWGRGDNCVKDLGCLNIWVSQRDC